ncbi:hypothetical protein EIMP300_70450 [Escherichia coli]|uniref:PTS EIIC type-1 domain-containing protein n=1 Tax=Escherichia coli TaxID=562 RepID=A0A8S0FYC6_ECOLX|nr:hypothetical protein EIMP300_70450 [Escherichia coli]
MSGFFPIMMFGLPGAALAMYFAAPKERRPMVGGMLLSVAVTAFLTGVTEPLEFLFMFLAPLLYLLHALLTGISLFVATLLGIHAGFSFSAGAIDYALMYNLPAASQNVWMLLVMGVVFFAIYFVVFSLVIRMFNLKTPGVVKIKKTRSLLKRLTAILKKVSINWQPTILLRLAVLTT